MAERLMTTREVADELQVHIETVRGWIRDGQLPAIRFGQRTGNRIRRSDLDKFLEQRMSWREAERPEPRPRADADVQPGTASEAERASA